MSPLRRVGSWIDSESVRHYQTIVYLAYLVAGAQILVRGSLPGAVAQGLGRGFEKAWLFLLVVGPLTTFVGRRMAHSIAGLWLQLAGDCGVMFASLAYVAAILQTGYGGKATFVEWVVGSLAVCALGMVTRDVRKIRVASQLVRGGRR